MRHCWIFLIILFFFTYAQAGISIDPLRIELTAKPGQLLEGSYTITNTDTQPLIVTIQSKNYFTLEENKKIAIEDWFKLSSKKFRLNGKDSKKIMYNITVPQQAQGFLMVLNSFSSEKLNPQGDVQKEMLNIVYSVPVYVRIEGKQKVGAEIGKIEIAGDSNNLHVMVKIHNTGNTYLRPYGTIEIIRKGKSLGSITLKQGWPVFPDKIESYRGKQGGFNLKPGKYTMVVKIYSDKPDFQFKKKAHFWITKKGTVKCK